MLGDWFRRLELPISFGEFERLPRHPAYKYEYLDGRAVLTPRPRYQRAVLRLASFSPPTSQSSLVAKVDIRPLQAGDWTCLPDLLAAAFRNVPPLAALSEDHRLTAAQECVQRTRAGGDGSVMESACFVAVDPGQARRLEGAVLITLIPRREHQPEGAQRPHLTWILVHPWRFAQGLGGTLLASAATVLRGLGHRDLASTFLVGNERSALWHWRNGFRLMPGDAVFTTRKGSGAGFYPTTTGSRSSLIPKRS